MLGRVRNLNALFVDRKPRFEWHGGLLLPGTTIQVSIFKDLVTLADPTSAYSFISFLHHCGRLYEFLNAQFAEIQRVEFNEYLCWVCSRLDTLEFSQPVERVSFDHEFVVEMRSRTVRARSIVLGTGLTPVVPACVKHKMCPSIVHSSAFVTVRPHLRGKRVVVVGGGQSGAEVFLDLLRSTDHRPGHCTWLSRRGNLWPLDDSPFTNELFTPGYSDYFYRLPQAVQQRVVGQHKLASDGVSSTTLKAIYQTLYAKRFLENDALPADIRPNRELVALNAGEAGWQLVIAQLNTGIKEVLYADVVILATGYEYSIPDCLDPLRSMLAMRGGELLLNEDFSAKWDGPIGSKVYVQNGARTQRGIADPNLSLVAWRSGIIANGLAGATIYNLQQAHSMLDWGAMQSRHAAVLDSEST